MEILDKLTAELERGFSKSELERLIGISKNTLSGVLAGKKNLSKKELVRTKNYFSQPQLPGPSFKIGGVIDATKMLGANPSGADYEILDELIEIEKSKKQSVIKDYIKPKLIEQPKKPETNYTIDTIPKQPKKEMPARLSKTEQFKWHKDNS